MSKQSKQMMQLSRSAAGVLTCISREEFASHGLMDTIELRHRNVCKDGFAGAEDVDASESSMQLCQRLSFLLSIATATVLLDVPAPWEALEAAKNTMAVRARPYRSHALPSIS